MPAIRVRSWCPLAVFAALSSVVFAAPAAAAIHVVAQGESLTSVAAADGLSVAQLAVANGLPVSAGLIVGQTLTIPPQTAGQALGATSASAVAPSTLNEGAYVVQPGDTLTAIAERAGTTVASLAAVNSLDPNGYLVTGTVLSLNGIAATGAAAPAGSVATAGTAAPAGSPAATGQPPYPTSETVSAGEIGSIAAGDGVPASLAAAVGWQESGFNNDVVSRTGATGVMQIEPSTWAWIQRNLSGGSLAPASAHDNVLGGVLLLHQLLADTGGDPTLAAAGYYQGLASVEKFGMYPATRAYVNDVLALRNQFGGP